MLRILTDDLQIHFLQLNHLQVTAETLYNATPIERWCWFLGNVQELTEATRVLDIIAQTPEELHEYHAGLKAQRDKEARIIYAQQQGIVIGEAQGDACGIEIGEARGIRRGRLQGQKQQFRNHNVRFTVETTTH